MVITGKLVQSVIAYAAIIFGVLTTGVAPSITLPHAASVILGAFGILLHPDTSFTSTATTVGTTDTAARTTAVPVQKVPGT